jgi:hypothetical protein
MYKLSKTVFLYSFAALSIPGISLGRDPVQVKFSPATQEYCHVLRFPVGWPMPVFVLQKDGTKHFPLPLDLADDYEFRVSGLLGTKFLVRGVEGYGFRSYTSNIYGADLSDPAGVAQPTSEEEWSSATPIRFAQEAVPGLSSYLAKSIKFMGQEFPKSGDKWDLHEGIVSPDRSVLTVQSWSGALGPGGSSDVPLGISLTFGRGPHGKLFFDFYNVDTGKKLITVTASFNTILPQEVFSKTRWVTERYFIIPLDFKRERCLVCEFGGRR